MAIYGFQAKIIGRSSGRSSVASASHNTGKAASAIRAVAYRMREALYDERTGQTHSYARKFGGNGSDLFLPANAPARLRDRQTLWNEVEKSERRKDAQLARDFILTLPYELTHKQHRALIREFVTEHFLSKEKIADVGYHAYGEPIPAKSPILPEKMKEWGTEGVVFYERDRVPDDFKPEHVVVLRDRKGEVKSYTRYQPHAHVMVTMRRVGPDGFAAAKDRAPEGVHPQKYWKLELEGLRFGWAEALNKHLALAGSNERVDHRSLADQGIRREPEPKKGPIASQMEREGRAEESHAIVKWLTVKDRNQQRRFLDRRKAEIDNEIVEILAERLKQMREGTRKVEIPERQFDERDQTEKDRLAAMAERREALAAFDREYEEEQKRLARTSSSREEEIQTRANRGDIPDANDRWAKAMHDSYNPLARPEHNLALAVGVEAERFREEQSDMRAAEAKEQDPAQKKLLEFHRQIAACDYMALGAERCANITGFLVNNPDNAISNRDREHAEEWREIGAKLREDRAELRETINRGVHENIEAFLKDTTRGWQPVPSQRAQQEEEAKQQLYGWDPNRPRFEEMPMMPRDLPANAQPNWQSEPAWRDLGRDEVMPPGAHYRMNLETGRTEVRNDRPLREGEAQEEITETKAAQLNKENTTFDQDNYDKYWERSAQETGRSRGGGMSR